MTQQEKKALWDELTNAGVKPHKHYREYTTDELKVGVQQLHEKLAALAPSPEPEIAGDPFSFPDDDELLAHQTTRANQHREPDQHAGLRTNLPEDEAIRIDEFGVTWYQDEVRKPGFAQPRGRRKVTYEDPGVRKVELKDANGSMVESFEMPGDQKRIEEARVTLPSYQVGIYKSPAYPL